MKRPWTPLRLLALAIGLIFIAISIGIHARGGDRPAVIMAAVYGIVMVAGVIFDRGRYGQRTRTPDPGWERTDEKFNDPVSGKPVEVWFNPGTGARDYRDIT